MASSTLTPEVLVSAYFLSMNGGRRPNESLLCAAFTDADIVCRGMGEESMERPVIDEAEFTKLDEKAEAALENLRKLADSINAEALEVVHARTDAQETIFDAGYQYEGEVPYQVFECGIMLFSKAFNKETTEDVGSWVGSMLSFCNSLRNEAQENTSSVRSAEVFKHRIHEHTIRYMRTIWSQVSPALEG